MNYAPFNIDVLVLASFRYMVGSRSPDALEFAAALGLPEAWAKLTTPMVHRIIFELEELFKQNDALIRVDNKHLLFMGDSFELWRTALEAAMLDMRRRNA
jgi:hypothetical protein